MTPEKILEDTGRSFSVWADGRIEVSGGGQVATLKLSPADCQHVAQLLMDVADGTTLHWAIPEGPERIAWFRFEGKKEEVA